MKNDFQPGLSGRSWGALQAPNCVLLLSEPGGCCIMKGLLSIMPHLSLPSDLTSFCRVRGRPYPACPRLTPGNHRVHITRHHANNITEDYCQLPGRLAIYRTPNKDFKSQSNS